MGRPEGRKASPGRSSACGGGAVKTRALTGALSTAMSGEDAGYVAATQRQHNPHRPEKWEPVFGTSRCASQQLGPKSGNRFSEQADAAKTTGAPPFDPASEKGWPPPGRRFQNGLRNTSSTIPIIRSVGTSFMKRKNRAGRVLRSSAKALSHPPIISCAAVRPITSASLA